MTTSPTRWIALLRGINVGGRHRLPMAELRDLFAGAGCEKVRTYIQSGNVVLISCEKNRTELADRLAGAVEEAKGFRPAIMLLTTAELAAARDGNPFPEAAAEPKSLHLWFLAADPAGADLSALDEVRSPNERFELRGRVFYLHAPDGIGRSKLAERVERKLGVEATARNWRTVEALHALGTEAAG